MTNKNTLYQKLFTSMIILFPIINQYGTFINGLGIGDIFLIIFMVLGIKYAIVYLKHINYWTFLFYSTFITFFSFVFTPSYNLRGPFVVIMQIIVYAVVFLVYSKRFFNLTDAIKLYKRVGFICSVFILIQTACFYLFGYIVPNTVPGLKLNYTITNSGEYLNLLQVNSFISFRPKAFFLEPSYVGSYLAPCLLILMFDNKHSKFDKSLIVLIVISMILTRSAASFVFIIFIMSIKYIYTAFKRKQQVIHILIFPIAILLVIVFIYLLYRYNNPYLMLMINRLTEINPETGITSGSTRFLKGFAQFGAMDWPYKLLGIGFGNYAAFSIDHSIITSFDIGPLGSLSNNYMNGVSQILVSSGLIGLSLYLCSFYHYIKKRRAIITVMISLLFLMMLSDAIYTMPIYVLVMCFIINM